MHLLLPILSILASSSLPLVLAADEAFVQPGTEYGGNGPSNADHPDHNSFQKKSIPWDSCTTFQSIWSDFRVRIDKISFSASPNQNIRIEMYKDASCNDEYGILANVKGATVAITDKAKNSPEMLDGDNKYPAGKDVVNDMKAFKIGKV